MRPPIASQYELPHGSGSSISGIGSAIPWNGILPVWGQIVCWFDLISPLAYLLVSAVLGQEIFRPQGPGRICGQILVKTIMLNYGSILVGGSLHLLAKKKPLAKCSTTRRHVDVSLYNSDILQAPRQSSIIGKERIRFCLHRLWCFLYCTEWPFPATKQLLGHLLYIATSAQ